MQAFNQEKEEAEAKAEASAIAQEDLRAALMVKDKVLEDHEKVREKDTSMRQGAERERQRKREDAVLVGIEFFVWRSAFAQSLASIFEPLSTAVRF